MTTIHESSVLRAVSPRALSAYARSAGWTRGEPYRVHSNVYVGEGLPEILVPRTERLLDYANVVLRLIETFAEVGERDQLAVYRSLVTADRDVVRVRAGESSDGSVALSDGVDLIGGARDMLLAAACSLGSPRAVYRAGANREAAELLKGIRLGQTDHGSFVLTLLTPVVPPQMAALFPDPEDAHAPIPRRLTLRLVEALECVAAASEAATAADDGAFVNATEKGVSANLCEALARMIEPFPTLDVDVSWARTRPVKRPPSVVRFGPSDVPQLREAARSFRERAPRPDVHLVGHVRVLQREETENLGTVRLVTPSIDGRPRSVAALLEREDYERAVQAHGDRTPVVMTGDLERMGQRWRLLNPVLEQVVRDDEPDADD